MTYRLTINGVKPLSEPILGYYWLVLWEQISVKFESEFLHFYSRKHVWKYHMQNGAHFVSASMYPIGR